MFFILSCFASFRGHCKQTGPRTFLNDPSVKKGDIFQFLIEGTFRGRGVACYLLLFYLALLMLTRELVFISLYDCAAPPSN